MPTLARWLLSGTILPGERADDLVRDMIDALTGFCARLYSRGARNRAMRAMTCARQPPHPTSGAGT
jgi:putative resolvase